MKLSQEQVKKIFEDFNKIVERSLKKDQKDKGEESEKKKSNPTIIIIFVVAIIISVVGVYFYWTQMRVKGTKKKKEIDTEVKIPTINI